MNTHIMRTIAAVLLGGSALSGAHASLVTCKADIKGSSCAQITRPPKATTRSGHPIITQQALLTRLSGQPQTAPNLAYRVQAPLVYTLSITNIERSDVDELTPVRASFTLKVSRLRGGFGATPTQIPDISICSEFVEANLPCYQVRSPQLDQTYSGTVMATAPWAGQSAPLRIVAVESRLLAELNSWVVVGDATRPMSTAARYDLSFDGFELKDTRSNSTDTVWLNLIGQVQSSPAHPSSSPDACKIVGFHWCKLGWKYGDAHNSGYRATPGQSVGSFRLTPGKEDSLKLLYYLYNYGTSASQEIAAGVADGFSKAGEAILGAYGALSGSSSTVQYSQELDGIIESFHHAATASCDGPLVTDIALFMNKSLDQSDANTLDAFTRQTGAFQFSPEMDYRYKDGDFVCDRRGSDYRITLSVHRDTWKDWHQYPG